MKKRVLSVLLALSLLVSALSFLDPAHFPVRADDDDGDCRCPNCDSWLGDKDFCAGCWFCEECEDICSDCGYCKACAMEDELHCPECGDACISEEYGDYPHCVACNKCESCVELFDTADGMMCTECIEERGNTYIMCPHCEVNAIGTELDDLLDESDLEVIMEGAHPGDCGEHCEECYEEFLCPECGECTLCKDVDLCDTCGICEECAFDNGYHCPDCGACYADVGQCPDEGEHCAECCEDVCENCDRCTVGAELEYCESCHRCEECWEHCEECGECPEENGACEDGGDHCRECCIREGWLCEQCERCTEALDLEICEYCGLCEECCRENSEYYGLKGGKCILDETVKPEDIKASKHDKNHHILRYQSSSEECHDAQCIFPGCEYTLKDEPHEFHWKVIKDALPGVDGLKKGICCLCGDEIEEVIPKITPPVYVFIDGPSDMELRKEKSSATFYVRIGVEGDPEASTRHGNISAIIDEGGALPETWKELQKNLYYYNCNIHDSASDANGTYRVYIGGTSNAGLAYGGKYTDFDAQGKKLTFRLAVYDGRGDGSVNKVTYSEPFTIDWNAIHKEHVMKYVCEKYNPKKADSYIIDKSKESFLFWDGTYHRRVCEGCDYIEGCLWVHRYGMKSLDVSCKETVRTYVCQDCGHEFIISSAGGLESKHVWSEEYKYDGKNHYRICKVCKRVGDVHKHDLEKTHYADCMKTIDVEVCKECGYAHIKHGSGSHQYSSDGDYNGWYGDRTSHWKICKKCGYVNKANHNYAGGACTVCGQDRPQLAIVGSPCVHGGSLKIELADDIAASDKAKFLAGQYGVNWIDDDSGDTIGLGKTYELSASDEGRTFRAEVQIMGGEDYNAYMEQPVKTTYTNVPGVAATCAAEGVKAHSVCQGCGGKFINGKKVTDVSIPKTNDHTFTNDCDRFCNVCGFEREVAHKWKEAYVWTEEGHSRECAVCGYKQPFAEHAIVTTVVKASHCGEEGLLHHACVCGYEYDEVLPAYEHKLEYNEATPATCVSPGLVAHYCCSGCGAKALDAEGKQPVGIVKLQTQIDPDNHVGGDMGYNTKQHYIICACGKHLEAAAHTFGADDRCTVCRYRKGSAVKVGIDGLTKHDLVFNDCTKTGTKPYYTDENGKMYLSKAGLKEVTMEELIIPVSTVRHVGGKLAHSKTEHWIDCACGAKLMLAAHTFGKDGACTVCGYRAGLPWWLWLVIAAVVVCAAVVIIIVSKKKKKKGEADAAAPQDDAPAPDGERRE